MAQQRLEILESEGTDHRVAIPMANGYMRAALQAIEDIAGKQALSVMLRFAGMESVIDNFPPDNLEFDSGYVFRDYSNLNHALISFYGRSGKTHAVNIGRRSARWMIENHPLFGFAGAAFKIIPTAQAIRMSINNTAEGFRKLYRGVHFDININITEEADYFVWSSPDCPCCVGKKSNVPICWIWEAGFIEAGNFVTNGKFLRVEQTQCIAMGHTECAWTIGKQVLEQDPAYGN